jgi:hypothetical protein
VTRREIFFIVSLTCFGIFILFGAYLLRGSSFHAKELEMNKQAHARQAEELLKEEKAAKINQVNSAGSQPVAPTSQSTENPAPVQTPAKAQNTTPSPATTTPQISSFNAPGCKVGDVINLGNVEMVVTKTTAKHKVIAITLKGNSSSEPPKLVLTDNHRIIYEIPADVDVNVDVTEKTILEKSPLIEQKAGK